MAERLNQGYDPNFLGTAIPLPTVATFDDLDKQKHGDVVLLTHTHFSLKYNKARKLAHFAAFNFDFSRDVDGLKKYRKFMGKYDPSVEEADQVAPEVYATSGGDPGNRWDRGHLAALDLVTWHGPEAQPGGHDDEVKAAAEQCCYMTNMMPQNKSMHNTDGSEWGDIERKVAKLAKQRARGQRVSCFAGARFSEVTEGPTRQDLPFGTDGAVIPQWFWYVIAYVDRDTGALKARSYWVQNYAYRADGSLDENPTDGLDESHVAPVADVNAYTWVQLPDALIAADTLAKPAVAGGAP